MLARLSEQSQSKQGIWFKSNQAGLQLQLCRGEYGNTDDGMENNKSNSTDLIPTLLVKIGNQCEIDRKKRKIFYADFSCYTDFRRHVR